MFPRFVKYAALTFFFLFLLFLIKPVSGQSPSDTYHQKPKPQQPNTPTVPPAIAPAKPADKPAEKEAKEYPVSVSKIPDVAVRRDFLDWLMLACTVILAGTAAVGTYYAVKTLRVLRHEAKIAVAALKQSSKLVRASQNSADALMLGNRAWILIEDLALHGLNDSTSGFYGDEPSGGVAVLTFSCHAKNYGTSPAKITSMRLKLEARALRDASDRPLDNSNYARNPNDIPRIIAPNQDFWIPSPEPLLAQPVQVNAINCDGPQREFLFAHGIIRYKDAFGREWYTRFNYRYDIAAFAPGHKPGFYFSEGPLGWNDWT